MAFVDGSTGLSAARSLVCSLQGRHVSAVLKAWDLCNFHICKSDFQRCRHVRPINRPASILGRSIKPTASCLDSLRVVRFLSASRASNILILKLSLAVLEDQHLESERFSLCYISCHMIFAFKTENLT